MRGSTGRLCVIDLSKKSVKIEGIPDEILLKVLGGRGFANYLLLKNFKKLETPLDPRNLIVVSAGLFVNTSAPSSGRTNVSHLLNAENTNFADSSFGGRFSVAMKSNRFDAIAIVGRSSKPCYLLVKNNKVTIEDAGRSWGMLTSDTEKCFKEVYGPNARTLSIGPSGEKLNPYAIVVHEDRAAGGSAGMVFGAKNLKAIVAVHNTTYMSPAKDQNKFTEVCLGIEDYIRSHPLYDGFSTYGTTLLTKIHNDHGNYPAHNWKEGTHDASAML